MENISTGDMRLSLQVRRRELVSKAVQMNNDRCHFNKHYNNTGKQIAIDWNLTEDVEEREAELELIKKSDATALRRLSGRSRSSVEGSASSRGPSLPSDRPNGRT